MIKAIQIISTFLLFSSSISMAGTVIEIKNNNEIITVLTDGKQARMNMGGSDYVIVDYKNSNVKTVDREKRQVKLFYIDNMSKTGNVSKIQASIKNLGAGPSIAGYQTQKFAYAVNGKACGVIHGSKAAYQHKDVKAMFNAIKTMMQQQLALLGGFASMVDACTLADIEMSNYVATIGAPMRIEKKGSVDTEVRSIKFDVALPADTFVIPESYKTVATNGEMPEVKKGVEKMPRHISQNQQPQMQQMLRQRPAQLPPGMMEQMRRSQPMMRKYPY